MNRILISIEFQNLLTLFENDALIPAMLRGEGGDSFPPLLNLLMCFGGVLMKNLYNI